MSLSWFHVTPKMRFLEPHQQGNTIYSIYISYICKLNILPARYTSAADSDMQIFYWRHSTAHYIITGIVTMVLFYIIFIYDTFLS